MEERNIGQGSKVYQIDQEALGRYKKILLKRVIWSFILLFVIIIERIFADYAQNTENSIVRSLQSAFSISNYENANFILKLVSGVDTYRYLILLLTSFYVTFFFGINAVIGLKIMYVHLNACVVVAMLEILFGDPRPFWSDSSIIGISCANSYGFPSYNVFCFTLLIMYTGFCYNTDEEDEGENNILKTIIWIVMLIILIFYSFLEILNGDNYTSQVILGMLYGFLMYYMAIFFDKSIDNLVLKSTIQTDSSKRYYIFWMVYLIIIGAVGAMLYQTSDTFLPIEWFQNYVSYILINK